jgi:hypothetical protein
LIDRNASTRPRKRNRQRLPAPRRRHSLQEGPVPERRRQKTGIKDWFYHGIDFNIHVSSDFG